MKKRLALTLVIVLAASFFAYRQAAQIERESLPAVSSPNLSEIRPQMFKAAAFGISPKVRDLAPAAPGDGTTSRKMGRAEEQARSVPNKEPYRKLKPDAAHDADAAIARVNPDAAMPEPSLSFEGLSNEDNAAAYGFRVVPPDPNGDVGPNHYVQSVNVLTRVFDKSGSALTPPFKLSSIFAPLGSVCSQRNDGDPIVLYDALADRWLISQFCNNFPPFRQLIAVSRTPDPTGDYFVYEFVMPNIKFNDYPKLGVWTDGFYMSTDEFIGSDYAGSGVFAFDKTKMLAGDPNAGFIYFDLASPSTIRFGGLLPSDLDGINAPPVNAPNIFVGYTATEYGDAADALRLFEFRADFANPNLSTFTERADSPLAVAAFDPTSPDGRADIAQPAPGEPLDAQSDRLMYRAAYRNFGAFESIVVNQTVRVSPVGQTYRGGVRLYELRKTNGAFAVREQATIGTNDISRWMGSAAQDYQGNLAVGFSSSSETEKPAIVYAGKLASEPPGVFRDGTALIKGTGVQTGFGSRWGDYSQMSIDPTDDCTFWLTNEYFSAESQAASDFGWLTRVGKFKFSECTPAPRATVTGAVTNAANNQPIVGAIVTANAVYTRTTGENGGYGNLTVLPNTYTLTATARGFRSQTLTVTLVAGQTLTQNFALQPTAILENAALEITAESCAVNNAAEPSETVTVRVNLRNTGAGGTTNLIAELLPTGGVINPSSAQNYGTLAMGSASAARSFTFTVDPDLACGDALALTFRLRDGAEDLGTLVVNLNTGVPRSAFTENFDAVAAPNLPNGWTTSATGAQAVWRTSVEAFQTAPNAAYSAAAAQSGVNELVSPAFQIKSAQAKLTFRNRYDLETTFLRNRLYDGGVLEIRVGGGFWEDIIAAGGAFESGGYDGVLETCCQNPLGGRRAWSGKSGPNQTPEFITTTIKLPARAAGRSVRLRWRVGTDNGTSRQGQFIDNVAVADGFECACRPPEPRRAPFDFDGDGKTDLSLFLAGLAPEAIDFYVQNSSNNGVVATAWGSVGDAPANADYDGDGKTDYAVFRPSSRTWFVLRSSDDTIYPVIFGLGTDTLVPADYDGDGKADIAVFRRAANSFWYILRSSDNQMRSVSFGNSTDSPVQADYDGDGKIDLAVFRPSNGIWYAARSSDNGITAAPFGQNGDVPVAGDFDGDERADFIVFRPSNGTWYQQKTTAGFAAVQFGASGDRPLQADFDGDGKRDIAVHRATDGVWYYLRSANGAFTARRFVSGGFTPLPTIFVP